MRMSGIPLYLANLYSDNGRVKNTLWLLLFLISLAPLTAQEAEERTTSFSPVTGRYRELMLGMTLEEVKEILKEDSYFVYRGDADVTMFNNPSENVIDCRGSGFIDRAWFQFSDDRLFVMELELDRLMIDYFTLYAQLESKYGEPQAMTPQFATWEGEGVSLSLEYPLTVKYLDRDVFDAMVGESRVEETYREKSRQKFAEEF